MKTSGRASLLILIFACGLLCKTLVRSYGHLEFNSTHDLTWVKKTRKESSSEVGLDRIFKSKRRIEKFGFVQKAMSPSLQEIFYSVITIHSPIAIQKPSFIEIFSRLQPPRPFSII